MKQPQPSTHPLESLLKQHCPNGVEFKELGELWEKAPKSKMGANQAKNLSKDNGNICFTSGETHYFIDDYLVDGEFLFLNDGGTADIKYNSGKAYYTDHIFAFTSQKICVKFLYYFLKDKQEEINKTCFQGTGLKNLQKNKIEKFPIPLPPLEIQQKIVEILDAFTELEAELQARRKQYEYYRNKLLSFEELEKRANAIGGGLKLVTLGEIGTFTRGNGLTKADFVEVGVPCIHYGQIHTHYHNYTYSTISFVSEEKAKKLKKAKYGDLVIAGVSEDKDCVCKAVVYLGKQEACVSGDTFIFSHSQNPKFIGYMFQTENFNTFKHKYAQGAKVLRVHNRQLEKFQIPLPPLAVQNDIVELLDKFDTLANDLSAGLPAEIDARQKQYEHYREQLLSFREKCEL
ncbi:restriction endonuclease subunit S [Helicobacter sp.]|uniref:restriction endonuclease subunit S n=1 Tax=Helicobacter sp. TaxID=218 RepID=UPI00388E4547